MAITSAALQTALGDGNAVGPRVVFSWGPNDGTVQDWTVSGGALVVIIGISPCAVLAPILFAASVQGSGPLLAAAAGFAACTIGTAAIATLLAIRSLRRLNLTFFTRYGDLLSGALVAAVGVLIMILEA